MEVFVCEYDGIGLSFQYFFLCVMCIVFNMFVVDVFNVEFKVGSDVLEVVVCVFVYVIG